MPLSAPLISCCCVFGWSRRVPLGTSAAAGSGQAAMPYPACSAWGPGMLPCGARRVEVESPRAEPAVKLPSNAFRDAHHWFFPHPLLKSGWNCENQTQCAKTEQGAAVLAGCPSAGGSPQPRGFSSERRWSSSALPRHSLAPGRSVATAAGIPASPALLLSVK